MKKMNKILSAVVYVISILYLSICFTSQCFSAIINVPSQYSNIQSGIDAAEDGDTVLVADGTYKGAGNSNISLYGKHITVKSVSGPSNCIIDLYGASNGFEVYSVEHRLSTISGFTIKNGTRGIYICCNSAPVISNCVLVANSEAGIYVRDAFPTINNCNISNDDKNARGAIYLINASSTITSCTMVNNSYAGIYSIGSSLIITNCNISNNHVSYSTAALYCTDTTINIENSNINENIGHGIYLSSSFCNIENCAFYNNSLTGNSVIGGAAISLSGQGVANISKCIFSGNSSQVSGGAIYAGFSNLTISNSLFCKNVTNGSGGGIFSNLYEPAMYPRILNCTFVNNRADDKGGAIRSLCGVANVINCICWNNLPNEISGDAVVSYTDIMGGFIGDGNISLDPVFISPTNYSLKPTSPCIDKASSIGAPNSDIEGNIRPQGTGYDMGAYEYTMNIPPATFNSSTGLLTVPYTVIDNTYYYALTFLKPEGPDWLFWLQSAEPVQ